MPRTKVPEIIKRRVDQHYANKAAVLATGLRDGPVNPQPENSDEAHGHVTVEAKTHNRTLDTKKTVGDKVIRTIVVIEPGEFDQSPTQVTARRYVDHGNEHEESEFPGELGGGEVIHAIEEALDGQLHRRRQELYGSFR